MISPRVLLLLCIAGCRGCKSEPETPPMTLPQAADQAIFASVEKLGPHRCVATISREDTRDGTVSASHQQATEIDWRDWDRFKVTRVSDGHPSSEVVVVGGIPWARSGNGAWDQREDAETWRTQLQSTWDSWDEALEPFEGRIALTENGRELIEGRWARRFSVGLAPEPAAKARGRKPAFTPLSLSGTVWLDELTAVRLLAEVEGTIAQGNLQRRITLRLSRSDFGKDLGIRVPATSKAPPTTLAPAPKRGP